MPGHRAGTLIVTDVQGFIDILGNIIAVVNFEYERNGVEQDVK